MKTRNIFVMIVALIAGAAMVFAGGSASATSSKGSVSFSSPSCGVAVLTATDWPSLGQEEASEFGFTSWGSPGQPDSNWNNADWGFNGSGSWSSINQSSHQNPDTDKTQSLYVSVKVNLHDNADDPVYTFGPYSVPGCSKEATAPAVTFADPCGTSSDTYTIPASAVAVYYLGPLALNTGTYPGASTVTITAKAVQGYTLTGTTEWVHTFTDVPCQPQPKHVTAAAPTSSDPCGTGQDTYKVPSSEGVVYRVGEATKTAGTYPGAGTVVVTAAAAKDYVLDGTTSWPLKFSDVACSSTTTTTKSTPTTTTTLRTTTTVRTTTVAPLAQARGGTTGGGLAYTGASIHPLLVGGGFLVVAGAIIVLASRLRRRESAATESTTE